MSWCWCIVQRVYINPDAVDDALVDLIHTPSGHLTSLRICSMLRCSSLLCLISLQHTSNTSC